MLNPKLRFNEFNDALVECSIGEIAQVKRGAASNNLIYTNSADDQIRFIRINDFLKNDPVYVKKTNEILNFLVQKGDLLIAGTGATAGIVFIVPDEFDGLAYSYNAPRIRVTKANNKYIYHYLKSDSILRQQSSLFVGNAQPFLDTNAIRSFKLHLPSLDEQNKIASFLSSIDEKISIQTKKLELLTTYKKGVMQKIFNREIRFKDDLGKNYPEWLTKNLGTCADIIMGQSPSSSAYNQDGDGVFLIQGNADIDNRRTLPRSWTTEKTKSCVVGDIILTVRAPVGAVAISNHDGCIGRGVCAIRVNKDHSPQYIYQLLIWYESYKWKSLEQGSTFTAVSGNDIKKLDCPIPHISEQVKIASFLSALDEKISNIQNQLSLNKKYKQGLLQQMFI